MGKNIKKLNYWQAPYNITFYEEGEYDQYNDDETPVVDISVPEGSNGTVRATAEGVEEDLVNCDIDQLDYNESTGIYYLVPDSFSDLDDGTYNITVYYIEGENTLASQTGTLTFKSSEYSDDTEFRVENFEGPMLLYWDSVLDVFCPEGSNGTVIVTVKKDGEDEVYFTSKKNVSDADENGMLYWTLEELNITSIEKFIVEVSHDEEVIYECELDVEVPIWIGETIYINSSHGGLVTIFLPTEITNATIIVMVGEEEVLNYSLDDFVNVEDSEDIPYWFYPSFVGEPDMNQKSYNIYDKHLNYAFEEGTYEITAIVNIEDMDSLVNTEQVRFFARNVVSNENITIEIFKGDYEVGDNNYLIEIVADENCNGTFLITAGDDWSRELTFDDLKNDNRGWYFITPELFEDLEDGEYEITITYIEDGEEIISTSEFINFYYDNEEEDDADDGVIINVPNGDEEEYDLDEDMDAIFATVSVSNELDGNITISIYMDEDEPVEIVYFNKNLADIVNKEDDPDIDGFTIYKIALSDLSAFDSFLEYGYFEIAFISENEYGEIDEIDNRGYNIEIDEDNDRLIRFWEADDEDDDEIHGEGEEIDAVFTNANILNDDAVVTIPKENVPFDVDNEFTVIIPQEDDDPVEIPLKLDELLEGDNYVIRVSDLNMPEFDESYEYILLIVQFYSDGNESYYAEWMDDDEPIHIYESPCILDETSLLNDYDVITIQEIPEGVDEFTITISKEGSDDIVKIFKFSEMDIDEDEVFVAFKLADLGITEIGDYEITVSYSDVLNYTGNLNVNKNVDIRGPDEDDNGNPKTFTSVNQRVVHFRIAESIKGYVKVYMDGNQVGENLNLSDLKFGSVAPEDGRHIILNDLNITESGEYAVKVELYSEADELLGEDEFNITVKVGENSVTINEGSYAYGTEANDEIIEFTIGSPLSDGQYFNIYFNGVKAGEITANGLEFNDVFTTPMWDVKIFKPGNYNVNVTFFDGESETDMANGTISINELTLSSDKEVYIIDEDSIIISFNMDSVADGDRLRAYYVYFWGPVERDDEMIFNPYGGDQLKEDGLYKDGVVSFDVAWITDEKGIDHFRLDEGTTLIYVEYKNANGERFGGFIEVNVVKAPETIDPALTISIADIYEGSNAVITVTTNATFSGNVSVQIGTGNYTVSVVNGTGSLPVSGLAVGSYNATAIFKATDAFTESTKNTTFTVKAKVATVISAPAVTTTYATSKNIVVSLKDASGNVLAGKSVTVVFNGVTKTLTTDDKGQVSLAIGTSLVPKTYDATFTFAGDSTYVASSGSVKVTVNKAKAKLTAKKKTFKVKKAKKYTVTLKTDKNKALNKVKVILTVKVKGKKVKITSTTKKGKATFNLKKLNKKDKYTATVKFAGNKYYKAVSKKVKITVK